MMKHIGGFDCLEGIKSATPKRWKPCCGDFAFRLDQCTLDVRFEWFGRGKWGIRIDDSAGGGYIQIRYCPHCGAKL